MGAEPRPASEDEVLRHETGLIDSFYRRDRKRRARTLIGSARGRRRLRDDLPHHAAFDERYATPLASQDQTPERILETLRRLGAPDTCYVFSSSSALDGNMVALNEALESTVGSGEGTVLSCVPARLAYFESEDRERVILQRPGSNT